MKILLVTPYFFPLYYGGAPVVYKTIIELSRNIISVFTNITPCKEEECHSFDQQMRFKLYRSESMIFQLDSSDSLAKSVFELIKHLVYQIYSLIFVVINEKPEVVICGNVSEIGWLVLLCLKLFKNIKLVSYVHGEEITIVKGNGVWAKFLTWGCRKILLKSDKVIVVSNYTRSILLMQGLKSEKIEVITNGVDLTRYYPIEKSASLKSHYGIEDKKVILSLARLVPKKGFDKVIEALPSIISRVPNVVYLIGGTGSDRERLENLAKYHDVEKHVIFTGYIDSNLVNEFINLGDIFVMPNRSINGDTEGFGLVFLEANACGIPVIGGIDGGTSDAIIDGVTGYRVDGLSIDVIADKIIMLLTDTILSRQMGQNGRKWVLEHHGWRKKVETFDNLLEKL